MDVGGTKKVVKTEDGNVVEDWSVYSPVSVDKEDTMSKDKCDSKWKVLYNLLGMGSSEEVEKKKIRCAVYAYCCVNGTSRAGNYAGEVKAASGKVFSAAWIVEAVNIMELRRFLRGNMKESYTFLKNSGYIQTKEIKFVAKAAALGIGPDEAFAMADWFTDCPWFTPLEKRAHELSRNKGLNKSRFAREGKTLEEVEAANIKASVEAGAPLSEISGAGVF